MDDRRLSSARDLLGSAVRCLGGREIGRVADLLVDRRHGRLLYLLVERAPSIPARERSAWLPVPWPVVAEPAARGGPVVVPLPFDRIERAPLVHRAMPELTDRRLIAEVHSYYGVQP